MARVAAKKAFLNYQIDRMLKDATLRKSMPLREMAAWGQRVAYFRFRKSRKALGRRKQAGYALGTLIGEVPPPKGPGKTTQANMVVQSDAGRTVTVAPEQLSC